MLLEKKKDAGYNSEDSIQCFVLVMFVLSFIDLTLQSFCESLSTCATIFTKQLILLRIPLFSLDLNSAHMNRSMFTSETYTHAHEGAIWWCRSQIQCTFCHVHVIYEIRFLNNNFTFIARICSLIYATVTSQSHLCISNFRLIDCISGRNTLTKFKKN